MVELIILLPLLAGLVTGFLSKKIPDNFAKYFNIALVSIAAILSYIIFYKVITQQAIYNIKIFDWIHIGNLNIKWSIYVDSLTAVMLIVVNTVSALVHIYSIGYMQEDRTLPRFMSYISLFTFFMLMLVTANNIIQLFFGWEGVGLCSYLLIGYWYQKESAYKAAIKAFIVNRVADVFFAVGIFAIFMTFNSIEFAEIFPKVGDHLTQYIRFFGVNIGIIDFICIMLFIGCMGKSAQIGLHTWLPDAMEGPTPVSALIHAATMVTAGVFLIARCSPIFEYSPFTLQVIIFVGAITALFAATIALVQKDIKRIIAYSTCSQLGYMFFACGVSAYSAGIFHLMTHAFFKALLFLGAGSVIHAMSDEQDITKMGGIWRKIPITFSLMLIGSIAIAGIPPFAGFFSKDAILEAAYASDRFGSGFAYICGVMAAFCTAFYSWRLLIIAFNGQNTANKAVTAKIHESPLIMIIPMGVLAIGAIFSGILGEKLFGIIDADLKFWNGSIEIFENHNPLEAMHHIPFIAKYLPLLFSLLGVALAYYMYMYNRSFAKIMSDKFSLAYRWLYNKYYFDEFYEKFLVKPYKVIAGFMANKVDSIYIDLYGPGFAAKFTQICANMVCKIQTGYVYHYALIMILGLVIVLSWLIFIIL